MFKLTQYFSDHDNNSETVLKALFLIPLAIFACYLSFNAGQGLVAAAFGFVLLLLPYALVAPYLIFIAIFAIDVVCLPFVLVGKLIKHRGSPA